MQWWFSQIVILLFLYNLEDISRDIDESLLNTYKFNRYICWTYIRIIWFSIGEAFK